MKPRKSESSEIERRLMTKDWRFGQPIKVKNQKPILAQCRHCQEFLAVPDLPACPTCQIALDLCAHGIACEKCSYALILAWIKEGNLQKGELATEQLATIKAVLKARFSQEVYEEAGYLRVRAWKGENQWCPTPKHN